MASELQLIYLLPRLRLTLDEDEAIDLSIGQAQVHVDNEWTWSEVIRRTRPDWLDLFRDYHPIASHELLPARGTPARGTIITAKDPTWLEEHIDRVVAVLYVLGQDLDRDDNRIPAEAFEYYPLALGDDPERSLILRLKYRRLVIAFPEPGRGPSDGVLSALRGGDMLISNGRNLQAYPPLAMYGRGLEVYRLEPDRYVHEGLTQRFEQGPYDRLIVACYHLFRTQFASTFMAPLRQDYAAYCACLEATLLIDKYEDHDLGKALVRRVQEAFPDLPAFAQWLDGHYLERSIFNHGLSPTLAALPPEKLAALHAFRRRADNWDTLREICLALIQDQLHTAQGHADDLAYWYLSKTTHHLLERIFASDQHWSAVRRHFVQSRSAETISQYNAAQQQEFLAACRAFVGTVEWHYVQEWPPAERVLKVLVAIVLTAMKMGADSQDRDAFDHLGKVAAAANRAAIAEWLEEHEDWLYPDDYDENTEDVPAIREQILNELRGVAAMTARYFRFTVSA